MKLSPGALTRHMEKTAVWPGMSGGGWGAPQPDPTGFTMTNAMGKVHYGPGAMPPVTPGSRHAGKVAPGAIARAAKSGKGTAGRNLLAGATKLIRGNPLAAVGGGLLGGYLLNDIFGD